MGYWHEWENTMALKQGILWDHRCERTNMAAKIKLLCHVIPYRHFHTCIIVIDLQF